MPPKPKPKKLTPKELEEQKRRERYEAVPDLTIVCQKKVPKKPEISPADKLDDATREKFIYEIGELEVLIKKLMGSCDELEVDNARFTDRFAQEREDRADIVAHLKRCFQAKDDVVPDLKADVKALKQAREEAAAQQKAELEQAAEDLRAMREELMEENARLQKLLDSMADVDQERTEIWTRINWLIETMKQNEKEHMRYMYERDRAHTIENIKINREIDPRVREVAAECEVEAREMIRQEKKAQIRLCARKHYELSLGVCERIAELIETNRRLMVGMEVNQTVIDLLERNKRIMAANVAKQEEAIAALVDLNGDRENALHAAGRRVRAKAQRLLSVPDAVPESDLIDSMRSKIEREKVALAAKKERDRQMREDLRALVAKSTVENTRTSEVLLLLKKTAPQIVHTLQLAVDAEGHPVEIEQPIAQAFRDLKRLHCIRIQTDLNVGCPTHHEHVLRQVEF